MKMSLKTKVNIVLFWKWIYVYVVFFFAFCLIFLTVAKCSCPNPCWVFAAIVIIILFDYFGIFDDIKRKYLGSSIDTTQPPTALKLQKLVSEPADTKNSIRSDGVVIYLLILCVIVLMFIAKSWIKAFFQKVNGMIKRSFAYRMNHHQSVQI